MNIFNKYGIKEVADVVFYSITRVGDEEFYTPVLFFDSLKVSTLDKSVETVNATGGKGNGKLLSWNFGKNTSLKLSDALFSQMSLDMFLNGRVMAKLSDWTSTIAKLNVANKYGQKNYSIKAFPSPQLTAAEQEILFRNAQKAGYNPRSGEKSTYNGNQYDHHAMKYLYSTDNHNKSEDSLVAENRFLLLKNYYQRTQPTIREFDLSSYLDYNKDRFESVSVIIDLIGPEEELDFAKQIQRLPIGEKIGGDRELTITYREKTDSYELETRKAAAANKIKIKLVFCVEKLVDGCIGRYAYLTSDDYADGGTLQILTQIFTGYNSTVGDTTIPTTFSIGNSFFLNHILYFLFPHYLEDAIGDLCWCDQQQKFYKAMPQKIIDSIISEIDEFSKMGQFENDLYEIQKIDRFERCMVNKRGGLKIDMVQQLLNIKKQYQNEIDNYTIYYDAKTMLPFVQNHFLDEKILDQKCVRIVQEGELTDETILSAIKSYLRKQYDENWVESLTHNDIAITEILKDFDYGGESSSAFRYLKSNQWVDVTSYQNVPDNLTTYFVYFKVKKSDYITLKYGTVYYKWTRTIDDDNTENTFIGTDLSIDVDTFSGEYMVVGETYIREQKTGKDQRYQIVLNRTKVSSSTKIELTADGSPTVFSVDIDVLMPLNKKSMVELRQYNVEEDQTEGGTRIVAQNKNHSYTNPIYSYEQVVIENKEIY